MLAASVHSCKRLLMEQAHHSVSAGCLFHHFHDELVLVCCHVHCGIDACELVLRRSNFVVLCLGSNAKFPQSLIEILHECSNARFDGSEIMVVQLLSLRCLCSEKSSSGILDVHAFLIQFFRNEEVFLLCAYHCADSLDVIVAKSAEHSQSLPVQRIHRAQKRCLFVQSFSLV